MLWLVVVLSAVVPYLNTIGNGFVLDDVAVVRDNPLIRSIRGIPRLFRENYWAPLDHSNLYRPVTIASYAVNRRLLGPGPAGFHLVNLALHAGASLLVLGLLRAFRVRTLAAGVAVAAFAVHPVHTEAVASVVGRAELLAAVSVLAALLLHVRAAARPARWKDAFAAACLAFGLFAKEIAAGGLLALLAFDCARVRRRERPRLAPWVLYAAAAAGYGVCRWLALGKELVLTPPIIARLDNALVGQDGITRLGTAASVAARYAGLVFWPGTLSADYSYAQIPLVRGFASPLALAGAVLLGLTLAGIALAVKRGEPEAAAAASLLAGAYFVISNLIVLVGALMAERFFYLPSAGLALLLGLALDRRVEPNTATWRPAWTALAVGFLLALAVRTGVRNRDWRDASTLFEKTARTSPASVRALVLASGVRNDRGDRAGARAALDQALAIDPQEAWTWNQLGHFLGPAQAVPAEAALRRAIRLDPNDAEARYNLAWILILTDRYEESVPELNRALALKPYYPEARLALAEAYLGLDRPAQARPEVERARAVWPDSGAVWATLGHLAETEGKREQAESAYVRALRLDPGNAACAYSMGRIHERAGRSDEALAAYRQAWEGRSPPLEAFTRAAMILVERRQPDAAAEALDRGRVRLGESATLDNNVGTLALLQGDREAARTAWRRSLELEPGNEFARRQLDQLGPPGAP